MTALQSTRTGETYRGDRGGWNHIVSPDPADIKCIEEAAGVRLSEASLEDAPSIGETLLSTSCFHQLETLRILNTLEPGLRPVKITVVVPADDRELGLAGLALEYVARGVFGVYTGDVLVEGSPRQSGERYYQYLGSLYEAVRDEVEESDSPVAVNVDGTSPLLASALTLASMLGGAKAVYGSTPDGKVMVTPLPPVEVDVDQLELLASGVQVAPWLTSSKHLIPGAPPRLNPWLQRIMGR